METPTEVEHEAGVLALAKSEKALSEGKLLVIHYKCDSFNAEVCKARGIAVKDVARGTERYFDCMGDEASGLEEFRAYAVEHANHTWLHWNMRNEQFGFPHIEKRMRACGLGVAMPELDGVDVAALRWQLYGEMEGHPRMLVLAEANGLSTHGFLSADRPRNANETMGDALRHVEVIASIWRLMVQGRLEVPKPKRERQEPPDTCRPISGRIRDIIQDEGDPRTRLLMQYTVALCMKFANGQKRFWEPLAKLLGVGSADLKSFQNQLDRRASCIGQGKDRELSFEGTPSGRELKEFCDSRCGGELLALAMDRRLIREFDLPL